MRKLKNKTKRPRKIWNTADIEEGKKILKEYGMNRKKEIWRTQSLLRNFRQRARELSAVHDKNKEKLLLDKLVKLGLLAEGKNMDDVLSLTLNNILERRLQTIVFRKGMANTIREARQFIVHGHIAVSGRKSTFPSYIVPIAEEKQINFYGGFAPKRQELEKVVNGIDKAKMEKPAEEIIDKPAEAEEIVEGVNG